MSETITIKIGGEDIAIPAVANFATLERIWPAVGAFSNAADGIAQVSAACAIVSGAILPTRPDLTVPEIKSRLRINQEDGTNERPGMIDGVVALMRASGLMRAGEAAPAEDAAAAPSTATSNTSSPS